MGASTPKPPTAVEVEDGEVDDAKISAATSNTSTAKPATPARNTAEAKPAAPTAPATNEPKRSDGLTRRDQILREKEPRASTPPPSQAGTPARPEVTRNLNTSSLPERTNHNLPSRPDAPFPSRQQLDRHPSSRHGDRRDGRDTRIPDSSRMDRPGDRSRDFLGPDHRRIEANPRDFGRASDRGLGPDRERSRPDPPPRWTPESSRENLERSTNGARGSDASGRLSRENGMPLLRTSAASSDRGPINPERIPLVNPERQELINPERAALISGGKSPIRSDSPRRSRDDPRDRTSRPQSPNRRHAADMDRQDSRRDERPNRNGLVELYGSSRGRTDDIQPPPAGPRSDRPIDRAGERSSGDRSRDASAFQPTISSSRSVDPDHGRLNPSPRQPPDPNFGRLNPAPAPAPDIPSGPRDRNTRGNRLPSALQQRRDGRPAEPPRPPTPEKKPPTVPTGPSSNRHLRHSASGQFDTVSSAPPSVSTTPAAASPSSAIHPDRLKHLDPQTVQAPSQSQTANYAPVAGIHPDRLKAFSNETPSRPAPPANQASNSRSRPPLLPAAVTADPPSGPKGSQSGPISSGSNGLAAPTGPASANERAVRGGRRQLAGINTMLQQAGQQNGSDRMNVRGRGRMSSTGLPETPISAPETPAPLPPPPARPEPARDTGRVDLVNPERADLIIGSAPPGEDRDRDRNSRRERSGRHSHRSSRSPDRNRDSKRGPPEDERAPRSEHRDRRGSERGEPERDRHQGRSPPARRDLMTGRDGGFGGRDGDREKERDRDSARRDGRERNGGRDQHDAGWGGGADRGGERGGERGGRRGENRNDEAHRRDSRDMRGPREDGGGRKRRSDEGGMDLRGHDKRPRR
jgi:THO complex subunit 2